ncbi:MAG: cadmium-translocating P-type ATPase, partial [Deltaproteobacteria bacterium]|nr:cadmium-translocating P-type ATPase [Deltaproteobacteria bacterium]
MRTPDDLTRTRIFIPAMDCPDEEKEIRAALSRLPAVESLTFHLFSRQLEVCHRREVEPILDALRRIGMEGHPLDDALRRAELPSSDKGTR